MALNGDNFPTVLHFGFTIFNAFENKKMSSYMEKKKKTTLLQRAKVKNVYGKGKSHFDAQMHYAKIRPQGCEETTIQ